MPPGPFRNGPFRYLSLEDFLAGTVGLDPLVDFGLLGVGLVFGFAGTVGFTVGLAAAVGFVGAATFGVGVTFGVAGAVGVGVAFGVAAVARGLGVAAFLAGLEVLSSAGVGTADGDPISWPTIVLRAEESSPTTTPIVMEPNRTRTSRRTARRMITTRRQRGGGARRTLSARSNYLAIMCIPQAASRSDADESPYRFGCVTDCSPSARCIDRLTIGRPRGDHDGCGGDQACGRQAAGYGTGRPSPDHSSGSRRSKATDARSRPSASPAA